MKTIERLNHNCKNNSKSYGITKFADLSPEEFSKIHLTPVTTRIPSTGAFNMRKSKRSTITLPTKIDWYYKYNF